VSRSSIPKSLREAIFARDGGRCRYCRLAQFGSGATFHVDHVVPRSKGGATALDNLVLQCPSCSLRKADKMSAIDPESGDRVTLFHPLRDAWADHFEFDVDARCIGRTPVGRATIVALGMNDPIPRVARACQVMLGLL
jgi:hypothetical protein